MKKVTAFIGSAHKRSTQKATMIFLDRLQKLGGVECEAVRISDYTIQACRGCRVCFEKGPEFCPLKDDRDVLMDMIEASDGVVFATPNYVFQVSGFLKVFIDRMGYICHRPRFFGKTFTSIVTQGIGRGEKIVDYLDFAIGSLGFKIVKGSAHKAFDPWPEKDQRRIERALEAHSRRFHAVLMDVAFPEPSLFGLMMFRMGRTLIQQELDEGSLDFRYYRDKGWFETEYYYPTRLGLLKKTAGQIFDKSAPSIRKMLA